MSVPFPIFLVLNIYTLSRKRMLFLKEVKMEVIVWK